MNGVCGAQEKVRWPPQGRMSRRMPQQGRDLLLSGTLGSQAHSERISDSQ